MNMYHVILPDLDEAETARYAGLRGETDFPEHLLKAACREARILAAPKASWEYYGYDSTQTQVQSVPPLMLESASISTHLSGCRRVAVVAVTIGDALENQAARLFNSGQYTAGLLLEAAGATAVEAAADKVSAFISDQAAREGLSALPRFSPGYGDWSVIAQPRIVHLAGGYSSGITVTSSCMLVPRKSITAIIGLKVAAANPPSPAECKINHCTRCTQLNCPSRKE